MPANKKYLTRSPWQRLLKISAGFIGGYAVMISFHTLAAQVADKKYVIAVSAVSGYLLWSILLLFAFLAKSGWKIWMLYLLLTFLFSIPVLLQQYF